MRPAVLAGAALSAAGAGAAWTLLRRLPPGGAQRWGRTNHAGEPLTLLEGPALVVGALTGVALAPALDGRTRAAAAVAVAGAGALGVLDDLAGTGADKGLRGHLGALARGRVTTGALKVVGIGACGVVAAALVLTGGARPAGAGAARRLRAGTFVDVAVAGGVVAGSANLMNLLDLRPGRTLKAVLLHAPVLVAAAPARTTATGAPATGASGPAPGAALVAVACGAAAALLAPDLRARGMLGDGGANAAGALLGTALVAGTAHRPRGPLLRAAALAGLVALTAASERISFTRVIESTPGLRALDALGRPPR